MSTLERVVPSAELARGPVGYDTEEFLQAHPVIQDRFSEPSSVLTNPQESLLVRRLG